MTVLLKPREIVGSFDAKTKSLVGLRQRRFWKVEDVQ